MAKLKMILNVTKNAIQIHKEKQQHQPLTLCTHAYDHITQYINNLEDPMQQNTLYTQDEDASLSTTDTTLPCDYNITEGVLNSDIISENK